MENYNTQEYRELADELAINGWASYWLTDDMCEAMLITLNAFCAGPCHDDLEQFKRKLKYHLERRGMYG